MISRRWIAAILAVLLFVLSGCAVPAGVSAKPPTTPVALVRVSGSGTAMPIVEKLAAAYSRENPSVQFKLMDGSDSGAAVRGVLKAALDMAVVNRALSAEESDAPLEIHPFARDAVVFAVRLPNPVRGLSAGQVRGIFAGDITGWTQLGGSDDPIAVLDRDEGESARRLVLIPLMKDRPVAARTIVLHSAKDMIKAMRTTPGSIGLTTLGVLKISEVAEIRPLSIDGVEPDPEPPQSGAYPWQLTLGLVYHRDAPEPVRRFVEFVEGAGGRRILEEYGYAASGQ